MNRRNFLLIGLGGLGMAACGQLPQPYPEPRIKGAAEQLADPEYNPLDPSKGPYLVSFDDAAKYGAEVGDILVSTEHRALLHRINSEQAMLYPVGVGSVARQWTGIEYITRKAVNPRWTPTPAMIARNPDTYGRYRGGVPGGAPNNPLGIRALYLGNTYYRIHGTNNPNRIGQFVSNGCINMHNEHVVMLYDQVPVGTKVIVV